MLSSLHNIINKGGGGKIQPPGYLRLNFLLASARRRGGGGEEKAVLAVCITLFFFVMRPRQKERERGPGFNYSLSHPHRMKSTCLLFPLPFSFPHHETDKQSLLATSAIIPSVFG